MSGSGVVKVLHGRFIETERLVWPRGVAERGLGRLDRAQQHLLESLQIASEIAGFPQSVLQLSAIATLLADAGEHERAVELYALASRYPYVANSRWFEDVFGRHIEAIAVTLTPEVAEATRERGRARDLDAMIQELLAELSAWDSQHPEPPLSGRSAA